MKHDRPYDTFRVEAEELLADIEACALDLDQAPGDRECVNRLFRSFHTLKGSGAMFGFENVSSFTHHIESVLDRVREGEIAISDELIGLVLVARDKVKAMFDEADGICQADASSCENIIIKFKELLRTSGKGNVVPLLATDSESACPAREDMGKVYRIRFRPGPDIAKSGMDPISLLDELRDLGEPRISARTEDIPVLRELEPERCYLSWDIVLATRRGRDAIQDVFIFVESESEISIEEIKQINTDADGLFPRLGEILGARDETASNSIAVAEQKKIDESRLNPGTMTAEKAGPTKTERQSISDQRHAKSSDSIRVLSEKLDRLVNLVGELVVTQSRLSQVAFRLGHKELSEPVEQMERLSGELRDCALEIRMVPIGTLFTKFRRLVRDLSGELGKEIDLIIEGAETELDKTIIERLNDPLVHLLRNSIDHGIKNPEKRKRDGKPERGTIRLCATHEGPRVVIAVSDDGQGIDPDSIRKKAIEKGLISEAAETRTDDLFALMFLPGFSTATEITRVSGRGVGMDVVKKEINALGGTVRVRSEIGTGTTFLLSLPLTLAIIEGLFVISGGRKFVIPIEMINGCAETDGSLFDGSHGRNMVRLADGLIPIVRLREIFNIPAVPGADGHMVVAEAENIRLGIVVDEIMGNIQTVIKPLDRLYRNASGISGATIMGDGSVALVVDVPGIIHHSKTDEEKRYYGAI